MFAYWPDLIILCISGMDIVTIDFSSLVEIASRFPYFEELEIQINCTAFPSINDVPVLQHDLETLKFSPLHLENHITLAHCIDKIFPDLVVLYIYGSPPFLKSGVGKEIQEIYQGLQSARKDHDQRKWDQVSISSTFHWRRCVACTYIYHIADWIPSQKHLTRTYAQSHTLKFPETDKVLLMPLWVTNIMMAKPNKTSCNILMFHTLATQSCFFHYYFLHPPTFYEYLRSIPRSLLHVSILL